MNDPHSDRCQWILDKVREFAGEHCDGFIFIAQVPDQEGDTTTPMVWGGGFNTALGMATRAHERLLEKAREADAPRDDDDADDGDDWKAKA